MDFNIYIIPYSSSVMGGLHGVVAAKDPKSATAILKKEIETLHNFEQDFYSEKPIDSGYKTDKEGLIYSPDHGNPERFNSYKK